MNIVKSLRFMFIIGNVLLSFRNVSFMRRRNRCCVYIAILLEILLSFTNIVISVYYKIYIRFADVIFLHVLFLNSTLIVFLSCYHAENFKKMLTFLESNNDYVAGDNIYLKDFCRKKYFITLALITYLGLKIILPIFHSKYFRFDYGLPLYVMVIIKLNSLWWEFRYIYEYLLMCSLLYVFSEQLECIIRSIVKHKRFVAANFHLTDTTVPNELVCHQYVEKISELFQVLTNVTEAIKLYNSVFGLQLAVMLTSGTFYVSLLLYDIAAFSIKHDYDDLAIAIYIVRFVITILVVFVLSRAGQRLLNKVDHLRRRIGKIYILSLADEKFYMATHDILEYISCGQIRIQAFGSFEVDMRLPPTFIMLFTSYTILALQFNNVL